MKKILNSSKFAMFASIFGCLILAVFLIFLIFVHGQAESNLGKQQQWASGKDSFDKAYEIAASDKDTPDKTLYLPKLVDLFGKTKDAAVDSIGQGASLVSETIVGGSKDKIVKEYTYELTNESSNLKSGATTVILGVNSSDVVVRTSITCNTSLLGYRALSFLDLVTNERIVDNTFSEVGLPVDPALIVLPANSQSYSTYASDGTTLLSEKYTFSGTSYVENAAFYWSSSLLYDYSYANTKGNLADTIRTISVNIEK